MSTAYVGGLFQHQKNGQKYRVLGIISAPMKHRKDEDINYITVSFLDARDKPSARRTVHLLDTLWDDDRVSMRIQVMVQISGTYRPDEMLEWIIYEDVNLQRPYARPRKEFEDGRFLSLGDERKVRRKPVRVSENSDD